MKKALSILLTAAILVTLFAVAPFSAGAEGADDISHHAFTIFNPKSSNKYYVNEEIDVRVGINAYYYSYSANGSRLNTPNSVVLEFSKGGNIVHISAIHFKAEDISSYLTDKFTPRSTGLYTVRVGYSKSSDSSVSSDNLIGSYTIEVSEGSSNTQFTINNVKYRIKDISGIGKTAVVVGVVGKLDGGITIVSDVYGYPVTVIEARAFENQNNMDWIEFPVTLREIGNSAFAGCSGIGSVALHASVESIGDYAFADCFFMRLIDIPPSVTSIGSHAFDNHKTGFDINGEFGSYAEAYAKHHQIDFTGFTLCYDLDIDTWDYMIYDSNISPWKLTIDASNSKGATVIDGFGWSDTLEEVKILDSISVIRDYAFCCNPYLSRVTLGDCITTIEERAFLGCNMLKSVTIPATVTKIGENAFGYIYDDNDKLVKMDIFNINGEKGSAAEAYAIENGFLFNGALPESPTSPTDQSTDPPTDPSVDVPDDLILGDSDGDGDVTILDATCVQRHLAELKTEIYIEEASDADEDGDVTILDATAIQRHLAELATNQNIGKPIKA